MCGGKQFLIYNAPSKWFATPHYSHGDMSSYPIVTIALEPSCIHVACCMFTIVLRLRLTFPTNSLGQHFIL